MKMKLEELQYYTKEDDIKEMSRHFDMLVVRYTDMAGYTSLPLTDPMRHRNWKHFERVWEICRLKDWDRKLYIEAQFERAKHWNSTMKYPQPGMMYSVEALRYFTSYLGDLVKKYKYDTNADKKKKGKETVTLRREIIEEITNSVETLSLYINNSNFEDKAQYKALKIYQSWQELSPYYLWSIPWFHRVLESMDGGVKVQKYKDMFSKIGKSKSMQSLIAECVLKIEDHFNTPRNIDL